MLGRARCVFVIAAGLCLGASLPAAAAGGTELVRALTAVAPTLDRSVLRRAVAAMNCALDRGLERAERLAIIDFSLPSTEQRLWIFDLSQRELLLNELVAHGQGSGQNVASRFSNVSGSHQSSIGLFRTSESYRGRHGYSLRMDGLEAGINDLARERAIVIHGADYVDPQWIDRQGRIGRSQGCPAVRQEVASTVVDTLKDGQFLFSWYPDPDWLANSDFLNCPAGGLASLD
tara:strand:- start:17056 stop:17751 length:696 start_codon:yes stop_codon:yes gene_type:complete